MPDFSMNIANKAESGFSNEPKTSFVQVLLEVVEDLKINAQALRLYLLMTAISRGFPSCWPPQSLLAAKLGVSERSVRQYLKELEKHGLIEIEHRGQPGQNMANLYHLKKLVPGKQAEKERKFSSASTGRKLPYGAENLCQQERKKTSDVIHEPKLIHESEDLNTHCQEPKTDEGVCVEVPLPDKFNNQETEQSESTVSLIEQHLKIAGVSIIRAKKVAQLLAANGRTSRYIEQWQRWIASQSHIQNPAAYLLSRIQENSDVPRVNRATQNRLASWSKALAQTAQTENEAVEPVESKPKIAKEDTVSPALAQPATLKLVVDNTTRPHVSQPHDPWDYPEEDLTGLRLVVDNSWVCEDTANGTALSTSLEQKDTLPIFTQPGDLSQEKFEAESSGGKGVTRSSVASRIDLRLKELMVQRDERLKRVKRLEVVDDTLYVGFWFKHEAEAGIGQNWLADATWFYPEASRVELV